MVILNNILTFYSYFFFFYCIFLSIVISHFPPTSMLLRMTQQLACAASETPDLLKLLHMLHYRAAKFCGKH